MEKSMIPSARDREMAEKWYYDHFWEDGSAVIGIDALTKVIAQARAEEREACAEVAVRAIGACYIGTDKATGNALYSRDAESIADAAIRARSAEEGKDAN